MRTILFAVLLLIAFSCHSQSYGDSKIIVTVSDSSDVFQKVKTSLVRNNFIVKDLPARDTLATYIREYNNMFTAALAVINGNTVTISGIYNLKKVDDFGYNRPDKYRKRIVYSKGMKTWQLLMKVANGIGGDISYAQ